MNNRISEYEENDIQAIEDYANSRNNHPEVQESIYPVKWELVPQTREAFQIFMYFNGEVVNEFYREFTGQEFLSFLMAFYPLPISIRHIVDNLNGSHFEVVVPYREKIEF